MTTTQTKESPWCENYKNDTNLTKYERCCYAPSYPIFKVPNLNMRSKTRGKGHSVNVYIYTWLLSTYCLDNLGGKQQSSNHLVIMWTWPWIMLFLRWELVKKLCWMISRNNLLFTHCVRPDLKCFAWQKKDNIHAFQLAMKVSWPQT